MTDLNAAVLFGRAYAAAWRAHARRVRERLAASRHVVTSAVLVVAGLGGLLGFASLLGGWCVGLVGMAESGGAVWFGLMRDDGTALPRHGERTPLEAAREHMRGLP